MNNIFSFTSQDFKTHFQNNILKFLSQEKVMIGLSWWSSLNNFFQDLSEILGALSEQQRNKIHFCFLDERLVALTHDDSNYKWVFHKFFAHLIEENILKSSQILTINLMSNNISKEYFDRIWSIDIALFWVWEDGHIASLFPHHPLLENTHLWYAPIFDSPKPPSQRITILPEEIKKIHVNYVFFIGEKKKWVYEAFMSEKNDRETLPVNILKNTQKCFVVSQF
jgi:6-phosphogluconolactonase